MKRILCVLLTLVLLTAALASCGRGDLPDIYRLAEELNATRIVTAVEYTDTDGLVLTGIYNLDTDGVNSIFTFEYDRYVTAEEAILSGKTDRVIRESGVVYNKDGKYSYDGTQWTAAPVPTEIKLNLDPELLTNALISEDGKTLTAEITPENSEAVIGSTLSAVGNIALTAKTNGTYFTELTLTATTIEGATLVMRSSYSRNVVELEFPNS